MGHGNQLQVVGISYSLKVGKLKVGKLKVNHYKASIL